MSTPEQIKKLAFVANGRDDAEAACAQLEAKYTACRWTRPTLLWLWAATG